MRFVAEQPNERWQLDITHWALAAGAAGEHRAVVAEHGGRIPVVGGGVGEAVVDVAGLEDPPGVAADTAVSGHPAG